MLERVAIGALAARVIEGVFVVGANGTRAVWFGARNARSSGAATPKNNKRRKALLMDGKIVT